MSKALRRKCVFYTDFLHQEVNPRIQQAWQSDGRDKHAPFGALMRIWTKQHCEQLDPYNTDSCPYSKEDCAIAYFKTVVDAIQHHPDNVLGYFHGLARWRGADRADNKPAARYNPRTYGHEGPSDAGASEAGDPAGHPGDLRVLAEAGGTAQAATPDLRGPRRGPVRIGELLGTYDPRTHQDGPSDGSPG